MKKQLSFLATVVLLLLLSSNIFAGSTNIIFMQKAEMYLYKNNDTLLNMAEAERKTKDQYYKAVASTTGMKTDGITIDVMGTETFIGFDVQTQMLLTQQKELYPEQMKLSWDIASKSYAITKNSMNIGLRNMYLGLYSADNDSKIKSKKFDLAQMIHNQNKIKYQRGMITEIDLIESDYNLLKARMEADAAKRNYTNMLRNFNAFIGVDIDTVYDEIAYEEDDNPSNIEALEYYLKKALASRTEVFGANKNIELMEKRKAIIERFPLSLNTVSVREDYENIPLEIDSARLDLEQTRFDIEREIKEAYVDVSMARKNLAGIKKVLDLQYSNLENMRARYKKGLISNTMLSQFEIGYLELEGNYKAALYDCKTKLLRLQYAAGIGPAY